MFTVKYCLRQDPVFVFDSSLVPAEHYISYDYDTYMFAFLNSHLLPIDVVSVLIESDGVNSYVAIVYKIVNEVLENMPPFDPIDDVCTF